MCSEQEIFELILDVAEEDEQVSAVCMAGSRTNARKTFIKIMTSHMLRL